jgi:hypothetical protein
MSTNYFGEGLRAKLGEFKLKYEAFAKDARISEKTVRRAIKGEEVDETTKQNIVGALGTTIEVLESLGRSRILSRVWVPPAQNKEDVYELTEILDAHHLFRALSGRIQGYGISQPQLETETTESDTVIRTNFEQLGCAHETENKVRLGVPEDHSSLKNAPEFDYSSFYVTTGTEHRLPCCAGFSLADQGSHSHPRGDFAPYRALFSVSCAHPTCVHRGLGCGCVCGFTCGCGFASVFLNIF